MRIIILVFQGCGAQKKLRFLTAQKIPDEIIMKNRSFTLLPLLLLVLLLLLQLIVTVVEAESDAPPVNTSQILSIEEHRGIFDWLFGSKNNETTTTGDNATPTNATDNSTDSTTNTNTNNATDTSNNDTNNTNNNNNDTIVSAPTINNELFFNQPLDKHWTETQIVLISASVVGCISIICSVYVIFNYLIGRRRKHDDRSDHSPNEPNGSAEEQRRRPSNSSLNVIANNNGTGNSTPMIKRFSFYFAVIDLLFVTGNLVNAFSILFSQQQQFPGDWQCSALGAWMHYFITLQFLISLALAVQINFLVRYNRRLPTGRYDWRLWATVLSISAVSVVIPFHYNAFGPTVHWCQVNLGQSNSTDAAAYWTLLAMTAMYAMILTALLWCYVSIIVYLVRSARRLLKARRRGLYGEVEESIIIVGTVEPIVTETVTMQEEDELFHDAESLHVERGEIVGTMLLIEDVSGGASGSNNDSSNSSSNSNSSNSSNTNTNSSSNSNSNTGGSGQWFHRRADQLDWNSKWSTEGAGVVNQSLVSTYLTATEGASADDYHGDDDDDVDDVDDDVVVVGHSFNSSTSSITTNPTNVTNSIVATATASSSSVRKPLKIFAASQSSFSDQSALIVSPSTASALAGSFTESPAYMPQCYPLPELTSAPLPPTPLSPLPAWISGGGGGGVNKTTTSRQMNPVLRTLVRRPEPSSVTLKYQSTVTASTPSRQHYPLLSSAAWKATTQIAIFMVQWLPAFVWAVVMLAVFAGPFSAGSDTLQQSAAISTTTALFTVCAVFANSGGLLNGLSAAYWQRNK